MKILIDARSLVDPSPGGIPRVSRELLPALFCVSQEHQFSLVTTGQKKQAIPICLPPHTSHQHIYLPNKLWSAGCFSRVWSLDQWSHLDADVAFFPNLGFTGYPKIPYAVLVHDLSFLMEPRWFGVRGSLWHRAVHAVKFLKRAHHLFAVSEKTKNDLMRLIDTTSESVTVIPFGRSAPPAPSAFPSFFDGRPFFLTLGANDPRKNTATAIAAFQRLNEKRPEKNVALVIVGGSFSTSVIPAVHDPGDKQESIRPNPMDSCIRRNDNEESIIFLNRPSDAALQSLFQHAAAFLYPSWYEGFGIPLHEAAHFRTPCLAADAGALPETAPTGTLFLPAYKPHLWSIAMEQALDHREGFLTQTHLMDWHRAAELIKNRLIEIQ